MLTVNPMSVKPMLSGLLTYMTMVVPAGKIKLVVAKCEVSANPKSAPTATGVAMYARVGG